MVQDSAAPGLVAIRTEMARQRDDALASFAAARETARQIANHVRSTGRLLLLGMGASHAVGRALEPFYRRLAIDAVALPLSEQLIAPLRTDDKTIIVTSQSGESAEVIRWLNENDRGRGAFGLTLDPEASLAQALPCLVGSGGPELAFAATRSLTISFALHLAVLAELGDDPEPALAVLRSDNAPRVAAALAAFSAIRAIVTSGRLLQGLAEALALGLSELSRVPALSLEGGQLRHGPLEMLGPEVGVLLLRCDETAAPLVASMAAVALAAGSPVVVLDTSGEPPANCAVHLTWPRTGGLAAIFSILPTAQELMLGFAATRVADVGTPRRSSKITRTE